MQETRQKSMTKESSLVMAKNLVRIAMSNICYFRRLFPDDHFVDREIPELGLTVKKLLYSISPESDKVILWVDEGVTDALERSYLKSMSFMICDGSETSMLEEYKFSFQYGNDGGVSRLTMQKNGPNLQLDCVGSIRKKVSKLVRLLIALMVTLDELPSTRKVFLRLTYNGQTPEDYEPPHFRSASDQKMAIFQGSKEKALVISLGGVETEFHQVGLCVRSALNNQLHDESFEDAGDHRSEDELSAVLTMSSDGDDDDQEEEKDSSKEILQKRRGSKLKPPGICTTKSRPKTGETCSGLKRSKGSGVLDASTLAKKITDWCRSNQRFELESLRKAFANLKHAELNRVVAELIGDGCLRRERENILVFKDANGTKDPPNIPDKASKKSCQPSRGQKKAADKNKDEKKEKKAAGQNRFHEASAAQDMGEAFNKCTKFLKAIKEFQTKDLTEKFGLTSREATNLVGRLLEDGIISQPLKLRHRTVYSVKKIPEVPDDMSIQVARMMRKISLEHNATDVKQERKRRNSRKEDFTGDPDFEHLVGRRIAIYWPLDEEWYEGTVTKAALGRCKVLYDDKAEECLHLEKENYRWLSDSLEQEDLFNSQRGSQAKNRKASQCRSPILQVPSKRARIVS